MPRRVIMWNVITLDGYFEGTKPWDLPFHEHVWGDELERLSIEQLDSADALLFGRRTYEGMAAHWTSAEGEIARRMNAIEKIVGSRTLDAATWNNSRIVRDATDEVARLRREPGKDVYIFGSADLSASLMPAGLIDEYRIAVAPVVLGAGNPLFKPAAAGTRLRLTDSRPLKAGGVILRWAPGA